ncbi:hypothetical protein GCM10027451_09490 [Geodermatophilus aquaeductus]
MGSGGQPSVARARAVKYIAKSPAKNISSLESQMIVPTLTMFGRVSECTREVSKVLLATGAVVTPPIMAPADDAHRPWVARRARTVTAPRQSPGRGAASTRSGAAWALGCRA